MKVFWSDRQLTHDPKFFLQRGIVRTNFEVPARAEALLAGVRALGLDIALPPPADRAALEAVHTADYLDFLAAAYAEWCALPDHGPELVPNIHPSPEMLAQGAKRSGTIVGKIGWYTADTSCPIGEATFPASIDAAAGALAAAAEAASGRSAYALARPPGHHAYAGRAGGHCYLNNAALAAQRLIDAGARRVGVIDIDSHHGNGTQGIFWERSDVVTVSIHGDPNRYYPWYVGHAEEIGAGRGEGCNLNIPLAFGSDDTVWLQAIDRGIAKLHEAGIDALVVSLGFDASKDEPLGFLQVTADGFARAGEKLGAMRRPTAIVQEGGYNVAVIGELLQRFLTGFGG